MLKAKPLDDQSFEQILESAVNRLPALCPEWTDYNLHDPGITLVELFSWYEELQRFHLDQMTDDIRRKLLALLGVSQQKGTPSRTFINMFGQSGLWPEGLRLYTKENICFELENSKRIGTARISKVRLSNENCDVDMTGVLEREGAFFKPFRYGEEDVDFYLKIENVDSEHLELRFRLNDEEECARNPFASDVQQPRVLRWFWNGKEISPEKDETHALSVSGSVILPVTRGAEGELKIRLEDPGCEEIPGITGISSQYCAALQQETWSRLFRYTVPALETFETELVYGPAMNSDLTVFLRTNKGWKQTRSGLEERIAAGKRLLLDTRDAVIDGKENMMVVCTTDGYLQKTLFSSDGLPKQEFHLSMEGEKPVGELTLICDSLDADGVVRPALWKEVYDISCHGPQERVFSYDPDREILIFGDGLHGEIVPAGENSILVASLRVSQCSKGNVPRGTKLYFGKGNHKVEFLCGQGEGGSEPESCQEAGIRFLKKLGNTKKCATAEDYERLARQTPGLRVAKAKALPGYDPSNPFASTGGVFVNVVVVPFSLEERPLPDQRFLDQVAAQLNKYRPICTKAGVISPRYIGVNVSLRVQGDKTMEETAVEEKLRSWFGKLAIGQPVVVNDLAVDLQKLPGIWMIERLKVSAGSSGCRRNSIGDLLLPPDGIAYLGKTEVEFY